MIADILGVLGFLLALAALVLQSRDHISNRQFCSAKCGWRYYGAGWAEPWLKIANRSSTAVTITNITFGGFKSGSGSKGFDTAIGTDRWPKPEGNGFVDLPLVLQPGEQLSIINHIFRTTTVKMDEWSFQWAITHSRSDGLLRMRLRKLKGTHGNQAGGPFSD